MRSEAYERESLLPQTAEKLLGAENPKLLGISEVEVRHGFVRKVYGILSAQLVLTTALAWLVMTHGKVWVKTNPAILQTAMFASLAVSMAMMCVFMCRPQTMRESPANYLLLLVFTVAESVLVGVICIGYTAESVLMVFGVTALVVVALSLFAFQTKYDITGFAPYMLVGMIVLLSFGFLLTLASWTGLASTAGFQTMRLVYAGFGALLFSGFIVMDTQMIVGGTHKEHQFETDDYAMAAIVLYIDIIQLFIYLLQLFGSRDSN